MAKEFKDQVDVTDSDNHVTISLNANRAQLSAGGELKRGSLQLRDRTGTATVLLDAGGTVTIRDAEARELFELSGTEGQLVFRDVRGQEVLRFLRSRGTLEIGGGEKPGQVIVRDDEGATVVRLDGGRAELVVGAAGRSGTTRVSDAAGETALELDGSSATLRLGREGNAGGLKLLDEGGGLAFQVTGDFARMRGALILGGRDQKGDLSLCDQIGRPAIVATGNEAKLQLGNIGNAGDLVVLDNEAKPVLEVTGLSATATLGGNGKPGHFVLHDDAGNEVGRLSGSQAGLFLGRVGNGGEILVLDDEGRASFSVDGVNDTVVVGRGEKRVVLDGRVGDIQLPGADCAEEFGTVGTAEIVPGTVLVVADEDELRPCDRAYDKRVAGVVSGANGVHPGLVLNKRATPGSRSPVALNGKVYCKVDASQSAIEVGDLLTTSPLQGHAMKACDRSRAFGAVLGKALTPFERGRGLIPILVSLL